MGGGYYSEDWGIDEGFGHNFLWQSNIVSGEIKLQNEHYYVWVIIPYGHHAMHWVSKSNGIDYGEYLTTTEFEETDTTSDENITSSAYNLQCDHVTLHSVVGFNATLYTDATDAYSNDALSIEFGIDWDELGTGLNAWNIIAQILFFQAPDIDPYINAVIAVPLWAAVAYLSYAIILVAIDILPF